MARINNGFLGNASGKLGNVVFAKWRSLYVARQYQPKIQDANSPNQQKQRTRMLAVLDFLKPINNTFIKFFNSPFSKNSTPWAKAIKANMSLISPEGIFLLQNLQLGVPKFPAPIITEAKYNPFIDQVNFKYTHSVNSSSSEEFIYIGSSVLGTYLIGDTQNNFDVRHLLCSLPNGQFWSLISNTVNGSPFTNFWNKARLWLIHYDTYCWNKNYNPAENTSEGTSFEAVKMISDFNTDITDDLIPVEAFTWAFVLTAGVWSLQVTLDFAKTKLVTPNLYKIVISGLSMKSSVANYAYGFIWDLSSNYFEQPFGSAGFNGSAIALYAVYTKTGTRVSRFNRIYMDKGSNGTVYQYFQELYNCNLAHPSSFVLSDDKCGFCGNYGELFSDFIKLWEQGIIHADVVPVPVVEYSLTLTPSEGGILRTANYNRVVGNTYYFNENQLIEFWVIPNPLFVFSFFITTDSENFIIIEDGHYKILMIKNRGITGVFTAA